MVSSLQRRQFEQGWGIRGRGAPFRGRGGESSSRRVYKPYAKFRSLEFICQQESSTAGWRLVVVMRCNMNLFNGWIILYRVIIWMLLISDCIIIILCCFHLLIYVVILFVLFFYFFIGDSWKITYFEIGIIYPTMLHWSSNLCSYSSYYFILFLR